MNDLISSVSIKIEHCFIEFDLINVFVFHI